MQRHRHRGFVLAATLWTLAILTIAVGYFADRVGRSMALARQKQEMAEDLVAFSNTRSEVMFRFATTYFTFQGLGQQDPIRLDDRPYRGPAGDIVRLQDNRGLLNANFFEPHLMGGFLAHLGLALDQREAMLDTLRDYTDPDNLRRLNGAESSEYAARGLPPPPNDWMTTPQQLHNVIGWGDRRELMERQGLMQLLTTVRVTGFNPNTAPVEILASLPGVTREVAAAAVKRRAVQPILALEELPGYIPGLIESDYLVSFPANSLRITNQSPRLPWVVQSSVTLTPGSLAAPWRVDYFGRTVVSYAVENEAKIPELPPWMAASDPDNPAP